MTIENKPRIHIPQRGLHVYPPPHTEGFFEAARDGDRVEPLNTEQKAELWAYLYSNTLKKRYPTAQEGQSFMFEIDYNREQKLLAIAHEVKDIVVEQWSYINPSEDISVILFGSVARGLVKNPSHPDPSNIDLAVIGKINDDEKEHLLNSMRGAREEAKKTIMQDCNNIPPGFDCHNGGNVGVCIQHVDKLRSGNYAAAITYIKANAIPLYDPRSIWEELHSQTIEYLVNKTNFMNKIRNKRRHRLL